MGKHFLITTGAVLSAVDIVFTFQLCGRESARPLVPMVLLLLFFVLLVAEEDW